MTLMGKMNDEPLPFKILKQVPTKAWELCDKCMELKSDLRWSDYCVLPIAAGMSVAGEIGKDMASDGYKISALYAWRKYKEIYSFDDDLADLLIEQADAEMDIPIDIIFQLPYPCVYIQFKKCGFFAYFENDVYNQQFEFRIWYLETENNVSFPVILHIEEQCTISEAIDKTFAESRKRTTPDIDFMTEQYRGEIKQRAAKLLQFVLYICAENSEREEDPEQKKVTRRSKDSEDKPKDVFREIRKWDVGYRIGNQIRRMKVEKQTNNDLDRDEDTERVSRKSSRKSPHARRGHWHHFWIGKHEKNERKLILKWVAPMFINGNEDDNITTIHPVK